ncbi:hypothetical protein CL621_04410 [archaeon]|nr:hypothetical protein [archaeon]
MKIKFGRIIKKGKSLLLAYDQGLEHGPADFNDKNIDPAYILEIAKKGKYNGVILQKGVAEKYYNNEAPLILKLNGKTNLIKGDPVSTQLCSVKEAIKLGAKAVGYTIYVGSKHEAKMFRDFSKIQKEAHNHKMPVIAWMYPRGKAIKNEKSKRVLAYTARIGLEIGADIIKIKYSGNVESFKWIVKSAGKTKVLVAGGPKLSKRGILKEAYDAMKSGASGMAIGRNVWQYKEPLKMTKALKEIIFNNKKVEAALKILK